MTAAHIIAKLLEDDPDVIRPKDYLRHIPKRVQERWCFSLYDLQHPENCKGYDELYAYVSGETENDEETDVVVYRNGTVTNKFGDGTVGVPEEIQKQADNIDDLINPSGTSDDTSFCNYWRDVWTDETGAFLGWAPEK
jgi:hypothetical protein